MTPPLKDIAVAVILVAIAFLCLTVPWYQETTSQPITQTEEYFANYISQFAVTRTTLTTIYDTWTTYGQPQIVFTLNATVTLGGGCGPSCWISPGFELRSGASLQVTAPDCQYCLVAVDDTNGSYDAAILLLAPPHTGIGTYTATATVTDSGSYVVVLGNLGDYPIEVSSLSVAQMVSSIRTASQTSALIQAMTLVSTINSTQNSTSYSTSYLQTRNSPYTVLGWAPCAAIIPAVVAVFFILRRDGSKSISRPSTHPHKSSK